MTVRVRFAPSPTGHLHIGGLRTALFNWLYARHMGGKFLLRIEDTDVQRSEKQYTQAIFDALAWTALNTDEPPVIQSERKAIHQELITSMLNAGTAYKCYCPEKISEHDNFTLYDRTCRLTTESASNQPFVVRFKVPDNCTISFNDQIHGPITFDSTVIDDFVIMRADGNPMYNFVVVADDAAMGITHVIRGDDHISNTPKQILLYQALNYTVPIFAHLPLILGTNGTPLSKRDAATSVLDYKTKGFLPQALCNYLIRLGWAHKDQEIFTRQELIDLFTLEAIGKKGAIFDYTKLLWINSVYIKNSSVEELSALLLHDLKHLTPDFVKSAITLYKERVQTLEELKEQISLLATGPQLYPQDYNLEHQPATLLAHLVDILTNITQWDPQTLNVAIKDFCKQAHVSLAILGQPLRVALVGSVQAPGIFELLATIGKEKSITRINKFLSYTKESS